MKRKHILTIALCLSALSAMPAYAAGWVQENGEWYYEDNYGDYVTDTWRSSGNGEYYLGDDGRMVTSALIDTGSALYYVDSSGRRVENSWRQLMDDDGELAWYYFQSSGKAKEEGYLTIEGTRYHFTDYKLDTGWTEGDDGDYYFDADTYQPGWHYVEEFGDNDLEPGWYYTKSNGEVVKGEERKINGYYYAFNDNGLMCDGWVEFTEDGETICKYYRLGNGDRMDGWIWHDGTDSYDASIEHEEGWYYLRNGRPYTSEYRTTKISDDYGVAKINNKYYCFDENGLMQYGIVKGYDNTLYYFGSPDDGSMKTGRVTVEYDDEYDYEGLTMYFNTSGSIGKRGSDYTGVQNNYLYENGELVESDGGYELVTVGGKTYVVNDRGKIKKSGTFTDDDDVRWRVQERADGLGYELIQED